MTFAIQVCDWLICVVSVGINQSQTRIVKDIINSENFYVIYLLRIIYIQMVISFSIKQNIDHSYLLLFIAFSKSG
jgi:hypothetical protein